MKYEVLSFVVKGQVAVRNGDGKIVDIKWLDVPIVQTQFATTLNEIEKTILDGIKRQEPQHKPEETVDPDVN